MAGGLLRIAVQQRRRLLREGLAQLFAATATITVVGLAAQSDELVRLCNEARPDVAILDADPLTEMQGFASRIRHGCPGLKLVGVLPLPATELDVRLAVEAGFNALASHADQFTGILAATIAVGDVSCTTSLISSPPPPSAAVRSVGALTERELSVLTLVAAGSSSREIAARLGISPKTVENHKQRIFAKLGVQNRASAVSVALRRGLIRLDRALDVAAFE